MPLNIEDQVRELPAFKQHPEPPPILKQFFAEIAPKITFHSTTVKLLRAFGRQDVKAIEISQILAKNPYYEALLLKVIASLSRRETMPSTESAVVLLGMQRSRDLLMALQLVKTVTGDHPKFDEDGKITFSTKEVVKYAIQAEENLAKDKQGYAETAYAAGLMFDYLAKLAEVMSAETKTVEFIASSFKQALKFAKIAKVLGASIPDFTFKKYFFSTLLIHKIGQILMALAEPTYVKFCEDAIKKEVPEMLWNFVEKDFYQLPHEMLGSFYCNLTEIFAPIEEAIAFQHWPALLKDKKQLYQLTAALNIASNMGRHFKKTTDPNDVQVQKWKGPEVKGFPLTVDILLQVMAKVEN